MKAQPWEFQVHSYRDPYLSMQLTNCRLLHALFWDAWKPREPFTAQHVRPKALALDWKWVSFHTITQPWNHWGRQVQQKITLPNSLLEAVSWRRLVSSLSSNISEDGESTASLESLSQGLMHRKRAFLMFKWHLGISIRVHCCLFCDEHYWEEPRSVFTSALSGIYFAPW